MKTIMVFLLSFLIPWTVYGTGATNAQIVILNATDAGSNNVTYNYLCWFNSPNPLPNPNFISAWRPLGSSAGPTLAQANALQNGTVVEQQFTLTVSSTVPLATVESSLVTLCNTRQTYVTGNPGTGVYYGQIYNGSTWTAQ